MRISKIFFLVHVLLGIVCYGFDLAAMLNSLNPAIERWFNIAHEKKGPSAKKAAAEKKIDKQLARNQEFPKYKHGFRPEDNVDDYTTRRIEVSKDVWSKIEKQLAPEQRTQDFEIILKRKEKSKLHLPVITPVKWIDRIGFARIEETDSTEGYDATKKFQRKLDYDVIQGNLVFI